MPAPTGADRLFARYLDDPSRAWVAAVCAETARAHASLRAPVSLGYLAFRLAAGLGRPLAFASRAGTLLDALQPVVDLADNLADEELDRARGLDLARRYPDVPRDVLPSLPALMTACVVSALHEDFPAPAYRPREAAARLIAALAAMARGQGTPLDAPTRVDDIAGRQAELLCLPLWLDPAGPPDEAGRAAVARWAFRYGRLWQLRQDVLEAAPGDDAPRGRFDDASREAAAAWPGFAPFSPGGALSREALLGGGP